MNTVDRPAVWTRIVTEAALGVMFAAALAVRASQIAQTWGGGYQVGSMTVDPSRWRSRGADAGLVALTLFPSLLSQPSQKLVDAAVCAMLDKPLLPTAK